MKEKYLRLWSRLALEVAQLSNCQRLKVGSVLVSMDGSRLVAMGYNGDYAGGPNHYKEERPGSPQFVHSEQNCLCKPRMPEELVMIVTATPCITCASLVLNAGIKKVYALSQYRLSEGWELLQKVLGSENVKLYDPS